MPHQLPSPRPIPNVGIAVPQMELHRACARLLKDAENADHRAREEHDRLASMIGFEFGYSGGWEVDVYTSAVHVYAAVTAEAVMNVYAVVRYGESEFDRNFRYGNPIERLRKTLHYIPELDLSDASEIVQICRRLFDVRDWLVHAKSSEDHCDSDGKLIPPEPLPEVSLPTARAALADLDRFIQIMSSFDSEVEPFLEVI